MPARRPDAELVAVLGARGCGKSTHAKAWLRRRKAKRLAIWDTKREHGEFVTHQTADIGEFIRILKARAWRVAFHPDMHDPKRRALQFDLFCKAVYIAKHCDALVEELAFVTLPSRSPPGWKTLSLLGRDENPEGGNVSVLGTSQRPASIDKDFIGNATMLHVARLPYENDAKTVAKTLGVTMADLQGLPPLHYFERGEKDAKARRGKLSFAGAAAKRAPPLEAHPEGAKLPEPS